MPPVCGTRAATQARSEYTLYPQAMIDTHCHLTFPDYEGRIPEVLAAAAREGVTGCITISTTTHDCLDALDIASRHDRVWCSAGVHPLYADKGHHEWSNLARVIRHPKCIAWGELGLDNHYNKPPRAIQDRVLEEQLAFILSQRPEIEKPLILHCREAFADLIPILKSSGLPPERMVFHCFTGDTEDMRRIIDFGAWVSFTGVLTYRNAPEVRAAAKLLPIDRVMVETDAPFLSPEPHRTTRPNEPRLVIHTARKLAELHDRSYEDMHNILNDNTKRFFGIE